MGNKWMRRGVGGRSRIEKVHATATIIAYDPLARPVVTLPAWVIGVVDNDVNNIEAGAYGGTENLTAEALAINLATTNPRDVTILLRTPTGAQVAAALLDHAHDLTGVDSAGAIGEPWGADAAGAGATQLEQNGAGVDSVIAAAAASGVNDAAMAAAAGTPYLDHTEFPTIAAGLDIDLHIWALCHVRN